MFFYSDDRKEEGETEYELVPISPDRWPAVFRTGLAGVSVFLISPGSKALAHQVWGLRQVGLWSEEVKPELGRSSLRSAEGWLWKWMPDCHLAWALFGYTNSLSKTTKLILLDSLLQEVCIESGSQPWVRSGWLSSQRSSFFRTNESPLTQNVSPFVYDYFRLNSVFLPSAVLITYIQQDFDGTQDSSLKPGPGRMPKTERLSKETKLIIAWFTSTRGVYQVWPVQTSQQLYLGLMRVH